MKKNWFLFLVMFLALSLFARTEISIQDRSPLETTAPASDALWDLLLSFDVDTPSGQVGLAGMGWDGTFFYAHKWSASNQTFKFDAAGGYIGPVTLPLTGCRDSAFDGTYMYGAPATSAVSCWDPPTGTANPAGNINVAGALVRAIAYDPVTDTFWSGNWGDNIVNWNRSGTILNSYPWAGSLYGLAYDNDPNGPYIYAHSQDPGCSVYRLDPNNNLAQLATYDATVLGAAGAIAGGAQAMTDWDPQYRTLALLLQGSPDYIVVLELDNNLPLNSPGAPTDVAVIPNAGGALSALVLWTCPSVTVGGGALTDLDEMRVYRNGNLIYTDPNPTIGGNGTYNDAAVPSPGIYTYQVVGYNDEGEGIPVNQTTWVGEDVPAAVSNLQLGQTSPGALSGTLTWTNPTTGLNGGAFNNPILGYHIVRYPGNVTIEVAGLTTSYIDNTIPIAGVYYYTVQPYNSIGDGGTAESNAVLIADAGLLIMEDFSGAWPPTGWTTSGGTNWIQGTGNNAGGVAPEAEFYWSPSTIALQRLITMPVNTSSFDDIQLEFKHSLSHYSSSYTIGVQTTSNGTTWNTAWDMIVTANINPTTVTVDINTPDVGSPTFQMCFFFNGDSWDINNWWIDDVMLTGAGGGGPSTFDPPQNVAVNPQTGELSWTPPANTVIFEDFDSYSPGDYLCVVAPALWQTWSNLPGGSEDVQVTDALSNSPSNSILVNLNNDIVLQMDDYTSGVYSIDLDMYVPSGYCGYFNLQKTSTPGTEWAFQVYFQTSGIALVDAGAASATTFPYSHDTWFTSRVVVDLNSDWADFYVNGDLKIGWQWTLGTFGTPGLLQFGGVNIFGGANSTTTDVPMFYVDNVQLQEIVPASDDLTGYNVYLNGSFVTYTTGLSYTYDGLTNGQSYTAGVSAVYDDPGESDIVPVDFVYSPVTTFLPPNNLAATVQNFNDVLLSWDPPGGATEEIYYHSGYDNNGIGTTGVADWICAARFTADELADYYGGWSITGVNIFLHSMDFSYVGIRVYQGGSFGNPGTLVYDQDVTASATALAFTNHLLSTPIPLVAGNEYWIGYEMNATGDHPAAVDAGPAVAGKGDWMFFSGIWQEISVAFALNYNWIINGVLSQGDAVASIGSMKPVSSREVNFKSSGIPEVHHHRTPTKASVTSIDHSRVLSGYKIYRDGVEVGEVTNPAVLSYLDSGLDAGNYEYYVTAIYTAPAGESDPSNLANANVVLPAPNNPTAVSNFPNILVQWTAPSRNRAVESYNIYQNGTLVTNTTSSFYLHVNVPAGYYVYNIAAVYTGGHEGDWSVDAPVNHGTGNDPNLIPLVTSLEGNYPNPFNPTTIIKFGLSSSETVSLVVYNIRGEKVRTLVNGELEAGYHSIVWDGKEDGGKNSASGVYFYKMRAGTYTSTRKMILMK